MESTVQTNKEKTVKNSKISKQTHIVEEIGENGEIQYNCTACRKTFRSRSQRYYHINCNEPQNFTYKCDHCDKCFARQTQWKYHTESHLSPINECRKCQKTFSNPLALKKHEALHEVEPKSCPHCDRTFKKKISLEQHIAAQHHNQLQYGCAFCGKKYASKSTLQLHLQTHEKKRHECKFCGKLFQRNSILNLHLKKHYKVESYSCAVCQKVFSESGTLARHSKTHEESALQYYCKLCDKSILRKDNMTRHLITIHPEEKFDNIVKVIRPPMTSTQLREIVEIEGRDLYNSRQEDTIKFQKKNLVVENKFVDKSLEEKKKSVIDLQTSLATEISTAEYPMLNQIKVITTASSYKKEMPTKQCQNIIQQQQNAILFDTQEFAYKNSIQNCDKELNEVADRIAYNAQNILLADYGQFNQTDHQIMEQEVDESYEYFRTHTKESETFDVANVFKLQSVENHEPQLPQNVSSVIRSIGNVNKNLTSRIDKLAESVNNTPLEYKHKKYCRNHYNIDLYRKILGCDEDDTDEDVNRQDKLDPVLKSSTPVHWRKCFKNNYETSAS